jgi:hypothetical protein
MIVSRVVMAKQAPAPAAEIKPNRSEMLVDADQGESGKTSQNTK